ncbi:hypothetical protein EJP02_463 [Escherichia phage EJP2]|nr:hypothetical protein EJP02_463 [Escherichia phage EJP2]
MTKCAYGLDYSINGKFTSLGTSNDWRAIFETFINDVISTSVESVEYAILTFNDEPIVNSVLDVILFGMVEHKYRVVLLNKERDTIISCASYNETYNMRECNLCSGIIEVKAVNQNNLCFSLGKDFSFSSADFEVFMNDWNTMHLKTKTKISSLQRPTEVAKNENTIQYHVSTELEKAIKVIDSNPEEAKRILNVMQYMFTNKG